MKPARYGKNIEALNIDIPPLLFQHFPSISESFLSLRTGSLTSFTSSDDITGLSLIWSTFAKCDTEVSSLPDTNIALSMSALFAFALELKEGGHFDLHARK